MQIKIQLWLEEYQLIKIMGFGIKSLKAMLSFI